MSLGEILKKVSIIQAIQDCAVPSMRWGQISNAWYKRTAPANPAKYLLQRSAFFTPAQDRWRLSTFETLANYLTESRNCFSGSNSNKMTAWQWALDNPLMEGGHLGHWTKQCCPRKAAEQPRNLSTPNSELSFYSTELWVVSGEQLPSQGPLSQSSCC